MHTLLGQIVPNARLCVAADEAKVLAQTRHGSRKVQRRHAYPHHNAWTIFIKNDHTWKNCTKKKKMCGILMVAPRKTRQDNTNIWNQIMYLPSHKSAWSICGERVVVSPKQRLVQNAHGLIHRDLWHADRSRAYPPLEAVVFGTAS